MMFSTITISIVTAMSVIKTIKEIKSIVKDIHGFSQDASDAYTWTKECYADSSAPSLSRIHDYISPCLQSVVACATWIASGMMGIASTLKTLFTHFNRTSVTMTPVAQAYPLLKTTKPPCKMQSRTRTKLHIDKNTGAISFKLVKTLLKSSMFSKSTKRVPLPPQVASMTSRQNMSPTPA